MRSRLPCHRRDVKSQNEILRAQFVSISCILLWNAIKGNNFPSLHRGPQITTKVCNYVNLYYQSLMDFLFGFSYLRIHTRISIEVTCETIKSVWLHQIKMDQTGQNVSKWLLLWNQMRLDIVVEYKCSMYWKSILQHVYRTL